MTILIPLVAQSLGLFAKYFPSPTGANALEEYVQAADAVDAPAFRPYVQWSIGKRDPEAAPTVRITLPASRRTLARGSESTAQLSREDRAAVQEQAGHWTDYLAYCAEVTDRFGGVLDLVRSGNAKAMRAVSDLSEIAPEFESVTNVGLAAAQLMFSKGRQKEATSVLLDQLWFLDSVERSMSAYVPILSGERAILSTFARHQGSTSLGECTQVESLVARIIARPPAALESAVVRSDAWRQGLRQDVADVVGPAYDPKQRYATPLSPTLVARLRAMTEAERDQAVNDALSRAVGAVAVSARTLSGPESGWERPARISDPAKQWDDLTAYFVDRARLDAFPALGDESAFRTRLRLMSLTSQIRGFWFHNGRFPGSLGDLGGKIAADPLNGRPFVYRRTPDGFEVFSEGWRDSGPIHLDPSWKPAQAQKQG